MKKTALQTQPSQIEETDKQEQGVLQDDLDAYLENLAKSPEILAAAKRILAKDLKSAFAKAKS
jgi:hypothetical protein